MERLAVVESDPGSLCRMIERAALYTDGSEPEADMFVRVRADRVEMPASAPGATRGSYCTLASDRFDRLELLADRPVDAMFDVATLRGWLGWLTGDCITVRFEGEDGVASRCVLDGRDATVECPCEDDPAVLSAVETVLPDRFDGTTFLDEEGNPVPTHIETTTGTLERLVAAVDLGSESGRYPVVVRDGALVLDVIAERGTVEAPLSAEVTGPAVTNHYGSEFARVVRGLDGAVTLQTGPSDAVAFVQDGDGVTHRFVVAHV